MRPSLAAAALGMLSLAQLSSAFLHTAPRHAARAALLQARGGASQQRPLGRAGLSRMMATVAPSSAAVKKLSNAQEQLLNDVRGYLFCVECVWCEMGCRSMWDGTQFGRATPIEIEPASILSYLIYRPLALPRVNQSQVDVFIFDCDGVIWRGDSLIEKVPAVLEKLRAAGKRMFFVTNNSTKSRKGYKSKFTSLGLNVRAYKRCGVGVHHHQQPLPPPPLPRLTCPTVLPPKRQNP